HSFFSAPCPPALHTLSLHDALPIFPFQNIPSLPLNDRYSNTRETETGYTPAQAVEQARRCLQCQLNIMIDPSICILCSGCVDICPYDCISMEGLSRVVKGDPMHRGTEKWGGELI